MVVDVGNGSEAGHPRLCLRRHQTIGRDKLNSALPEGRRQMPGDTAGGAAAARCRRLLCSADRAELACGRRVRAAPEPSLCAASRRRPAAAR